MWETIDGSPDFQLLAVLIDRDRVHSCFAGRGEELQDVDSSIRVDMSTDDESVRFYPRGASGCGSPRHWIHIAEHQLISDEPVRDGSLLRCRLVAQHNGTPLLTATGDLPSHEGTWCTTEGSPDFRLLGVLRDEDRVYSCFVGEADDMLSTPERQIGVSLLSDCGSVEFSFHSFAQNGAPGHWHYVATHRLIVDQPLRDVLPLRYRLEVHHAGTMLLAAEGELGADPTDS